MRTLAFAAAASVTLGACAAITGLGDYVIDSNADAAASEASAQPIDGDAHAPGTDGSVTATEAGVDAEVRDASVDVVVITGDGSVPSYADCNALHNASPGTGSNIYVFHAAGTTFSAYCDMTLAGGGWMLVGQSAAGAPATSFGWHKATGVVGDASKPYALDVVSHAVAIHEVLVVSGTRAAPSAAYLLKPPVGFPTGYETSLASVQMVTKIVNPDCMGAMGSAPKMLMYMGASNATTGFEFRDVSAPDVFGLTNDGWELNYGNNCDLTGYLHKQQGLVFVR